MTILVSVLLSFSSFAMELQLDSDLEDIQKKAQEIKVASGGKLDITISKIEGRDDVFDVKVNGKEDCSMTKEYSGEVITFSEMVHLTTHYNTTYDLIETISHEFGFTLMGSSSKMMNRHNVDSVYIRSCLK